MTKEAVWLAVSFERISKGSQYTRSELAGLWGMGGYEAISRGIFTPAGGGQIILFITKEKRPGETPYKNLILKGILHIDGENSHASDERIVNAEADAEDIHVFYREKHNMRFTYMGCAHLIEHKLCSDKPSEFRFAAKW